MYNLNTGQARTDLYGINKGAAQVVDLSPLRDLQKQDFQAQEAHKLARAKALEDARKRSTDLLNNKIGEVRPADLPYFSEKTKQYSQDVLDAIKKDGGNLSIESEARLNQQHAANVQEALASKNRGDQENSILNHLNSNEVDYRTGEHLKFHNAMAAPSNGNYNAPIVPVKTFHIEKEVVAPLQEKIAHLVNENEKNNIKTWTPEKAAATAATLGDDPRVAKEIHSQAEEMHPEQFQAMLADTYLQPKDKYGNANPAYIADPVAREQKAQAIKAMTPNDLTTEDNKAIMANQFVHRFIIKGEKPESKGSTFILGSSSDRGRLKTYVNKEGVMTTDTGTTGEAPSAKNMDIKNPDTGEEENRMLKNPIIQLDPKTGAFVGGKFTVLPTKDQEDKNDITKSQNKANYDDLQYYLREYKDKNPAPERSKGVAGYFADSDSEYKAKVDKWQADINSKTKELEAKYPQEKMPYPEKVVNVSSGDKESQDVLRRLYQNTYGGTIEEAKEGKLGHDFSSDFRPGVVPSGKKDQTEIDNKAKGVPADEQKMMDKSKEANLVPKNQSEFDTKWATLKKGESLKAPNGKTYVK